MEISSKKLRVDGKDLKIATFKTPSIFHAYKLRNATRIQMVLFNNANNAMNHGLRKRMFVLSTTIMYIFTDKICCSTMM